MASIVSNGYNGKCIALDVWETGAYNSSNSTREYGWRLYGTGGSGYHMAGAFYAAIGGVDVYSSATRIQLWNGTEVASGSLWLQHDNAGNKWVDMYCEAGIYTNAVNCQASGGFQGSTIPRYANITNFYATEITQSSFKFVVSTDAGIDYVQHSLNGGGWTDSGSQVIGNLVPGTGYDIRCRVKRTDSQLWTESWHIYPTTLAFGKITGGNDLTDEGNGYITFNNPGGNSVQNFDAAMCWDGSNALAAYQAVTKTATNYTFSLTTAERTAIISKLNTKNSLGFTYYLRSKINGNYYYSTLNKTISIVNATPVMNGFSYQDTNATTKALTGNDQIIIKGKSNLKVYNITATALKSATKKTVIVDSIGETWSDTYNKTINGYSKNTIGVAMTDSRDNTSAVMTKTFPADQYKEYFNITKGAQSATRGGNGVGEATTFSVKGTWFNASFGAVANTLTASYRYRKTGTTTWTTGTTALTVTKSGNNFSIDQVLKGDTAAGFNIEYAYDVEIIFTDKLSTVTFSLTLIAGSPAIAILGNKIALGGKLDEASSFDVQIRKTAEFIGELISNAGYVSKYRGAVSNFNNCLTEGVYHVGSSNLTGAPYTGNIYGKLFVYVNDATTHNNSSNWIWQIFIDTSNMMYRRQKINSGAWTGWERQYGSLSEITNIIYPVGTVYLSNSITNPGAKLGGTWAKIPDGYLLNSSSEYLTTGGSWYSDATSLTAATIGSHRHGVSRSGAVLSGGYNSLYNNNGGIEIGFHTENEGGGQGHTHHVTPPYVKICAWYRTA